MSNPVGRPPKYSNPDEILKQFEEYKKEEKEYQSLSGFCYFLGTHRDYLVSLENDKPEFSNAVKSIRDYFALYTIKHAQTSEKNQALNIFLLKNYGYKDKTEQDINIKNVKSLTELADQADNE